VTNAASLAQNQTGINSLLLFDLPMEVGWKVGELPMHVFGDFAPILKPTSAPRLRDTPAWQSALRHIRLAPALAS